MQAIFHYTVLILPLAFFIWIVRENFPSWLTLITYSFMKLSYMGSQEEQHLLATSLKAQEKINKLQGMGFSLLGVKVEKLPLWGKAYPEISLVSANAETYASIMFDEFKRPAEVYFYTPMRGHGLVFTRTYAAGKEVEWADTSVKNVPSRNLEEAFESHHQRLGLFKERGLLPEIGCSQQARLEATRMFYASQYYRLQSRSLLLFSSMAFVFAILVVALGLFWATHPR